MTLRTIGPNLTLSYSMKANFVNVLCSKILYISSIVIVTGLGKMYIIEPKSKMMKYSMSLLKLCIGKTLGAANLLTFQNQHDKEFFRSRNYISKRTQTFVMNGSGVNTAYYKAKPITNYNTVLLIGRLIEAKGIREFCRAVAEIDQDNWRYQIVGWKETGSDAISPQEINHLSDGKVQYLGSSKDVRKLIYDSTFVILPAYREGLARSLLEGMACGRPILMANAPGMSDLHDDKHSLLFLSQNHKSIKSTLIAIKKLSRSKIDLMGKYARKAVVEKYDAQAVAKTFVAEMERY
ncbi:glycosyltransferase [Alphaproteobacteria bacterium]|nr:glycosyltransferase [Alphaproteobacteria bacterium]